jgi:hypothetical protein
MKVLTWAAVAVTTLFALMNLGAAIDGEIDTGYRIAGAVLGVIGIVAAIGLGAGRAWGRAAVIGIGGLNVATAVTGLFTDQDGSVIGLVVGGLGVVLGVLATAGTGHRVVA